MTSCTHERAVPVEVRDRTTGGTTVVAQICSDCLDELPAAWGCPNCEWVEGPRALCEDVAALLPGRPCQRHAV